MISFKNVAGDFHKKVPAIAEAIANATFEVGIPVIAKNNIDEFYRRCCAVAIINNKGPFSAPKKKPIEATWIRRAYIELLVGLETDATSLNHREFDNKIQHDLDLRINEALKESKAPKLIQVMMSVDRQIKRNEMTPKEQTFWGRVLTGTQLVMVCFWSTCREDSKLIDEAFQKFEKDYPFLRRDKFNITVREVEKGDNLFY